MFTQAESLVSADRHLADRRHSCALRERALRRTGSDCGSHTAGASSDGSEPIRCFDDSNTHSGAMANRG